MQAAWLLLHPNRRATVGVDLGPDTVPAFASSRPLLFCLLNVIKATQLLLHLKGRAAAPVSSSPCLAETVLGKTRF